MTIEGSGSPGDDLTPSLVLRLRQGDAYAGELLVRAYRSAIVRFAWGYLHSDADAEDAAQEIFTKVLSADTVPDDFRVWLYRIARNHCLNLIRNRGRRRDDGHLPTGLDPTGKMTGNLTRMLAEEERLQLLRALSELPEAEREVLRLRYTEELSRQEIAEVLDIAESVVKSRLFEGLQKLRSKAARFAAE